jgi:hypothetical protein
LLKIAIPVKEVNQFSLDVAFSAFAEIGLFTEITVSPLIPSNIFALISSPSRQRNGNAKIEVTDLRDGSTVPVGAATN